MNIFQNILKLEKSGTIDFQFPRFIFYHILILSTDYEFSMENLFDILRLNRLIFLKTKFDKFLVELPRNNTLNDNNSRVNVMDNFLLKFATGFHYLFNTDEKFNKFLNDQEKIVFPEVPTFDPRKTFNHKESIDPMIKFLMLNFILIVIVFLIIYKNYYQTDKLLSRYDRIKIVIKSKTSILVAILILLIGSFSFIVKYLIDEKKDRRNDF